MRTFLAFTHLKNETTLDIAGPITRSRDNCRRKFILR
jgi:hypothetical protein